MTSKYSYRDRDNTNLDHHQLEKMLEGHRKRIENTVEPLRPHDKEAMIMLVQFIMDGKKIPEKRIKKVVPQSNPRRIKQLLVKYGAIAMVNKEWTIPKPEVIRQLLFMPEQKEKYYWDK